MIWIIAGFILTVLVVAGIEMSVITSSTSKYDIYPDVYATVYVARSIIIAGLLGGVFYFSSDMQEIFRIALMGGSYLLTLGICYTIRHTKTGFILSSIIYALFLVTVFSALVWSQTGSIGWTIVAAIVGCILISNLQIELGDLSFGESSSGYIYGGSSIYGSYGSSSGTSSSTDKPKNVYCDSCDYIMFTGGLPPGTPPYVCKYKGMVFPSSPACDKYKRT